MAQRAFPLFVTLKVWNTYALSPVSYWPQMLTMSQALIASLLAFPKQIMGGDNGWISPLDLGYLMA